VLKRFSETVIACFDGDEAGRKAAARSFPVFIEAGLWGRGVFLPAGDDPDTFVRAKGGAALVAEIERAERWSTPTSRRSPARGSTRSAARRWRQRGRARASWRPQSFRARGPHPARRVSARRARRGARRRGARAVTRDAGDESLDHARSAEEELVELMAIDPSIVARVEESGIVADFEQPEWRRLAQVVIDGARIGGVDRAAAARAPRPRRSPFDRG
jgi:DNA primase